MASATTNPPHERPTHIRWVVLGTVAFASASAYLTRYCISASNTTIQKDLGLDDKQMGWVMSAFGLGYLLFQIPGGWLGNRLGTRAAFPLISAIWSLCNSWSAAAYAMPAMLASRFSIGAFQAGLVPISARIVKDWIPLGRRGLSSAWIGACMSIGGAFTLWFTGWLLDQGNDWRGIFNVYSLVGIVWALGFSWYFRTYPREHSAVNQAELKLIGGAESGIEESSGKDSRGGGQRADRDREQAEICGAELVRRMLACRSLWALCVQSFFRAAGYVFFVTWFFAFLEYVYGVERQDAGLLNSLPLLAVVLGTTSGGLIVDSLLGATGNKWISRSGTAIAALGACALLTCASAWTASATQLAVVIAAGAFFSGIGNPAAWAATIDLGGRHTALFVATMNMAGCVAGVILPAVLGDWFDQLRRSGGNWNAVIYLHAGFYLAGAIAWLAVNPNDAPTERTPRSAPPVGRNSFDRM